MDIPSAAGVSNGDGGVWILRTSQKHIEHTSDLLALRHE